MSEIYLRIVAGCYWENAEPSFEPFYVKNFFDTATPAAIEAVEGTIADGFPDGAPLQVTYIGHRPVELTEQEVAGLGFRLLNWA